MKNLKKNILFFILINIFLIACKKDEEDISKPTISFIEPSQNDTISLSTVDSIQLKLTVTDNKSLHELSIKITNNIGAVIFSSIPDVHDKTNYEFNKYFQTSNVLTPTPMNLTVIVSDHDENTESKTLNFVLKP